jgi:hypothetical protein
MSYELNFINGPLDGLDLHGDAVDACGNGTQYADSIYRQTQDGSDGAVIEAFDPHVLNATFERSIVRLHAYRVDRVTRFEVTSGRSLVPVHVAIRLLNVGPTKRFAILERMPAAT